MREDHRRDNAGARRAGISPDRRSTPSSPDIMTKHAPSGSAHIRRLASATCILATFAFTGPAMAQERIRISSDWGNVVAELVDGEAAQSLRRMLPLTIAMRDHLRQEKTGQLPAALPAAERQTDFSVGTLGLWGATSFVIYYRSGQVPSPGIVILGRVQGDVSIFDRPGPVTVRVEAID